MTSNKLKEELLRQEEAFLRSMQTKLNEQLNRLKVEEVALLKLLSTDSGTEESSCLNPTVYVDDAGDHGNHDAHMQQYGVEPLQPSTADSNTTMTGYSICQSPDIMQSSETHVLDDHDGEDPATVNQIPLGNLQPINTPVKQESEEIEEEIDDET